ncbi:MAG: aminodeoxychorismate/anthranilate synthase component II [Saprospiraceae bacterium]
MNIALIDNYDSFTYILAQYFEEQPNVLLKVFKNDDHSDSDLRVFDKIVISPGPGLPSQNGAIIQTIKRLSGHIPILGVCLGMQAIFEAFGGRLFNLNCVHHGVSSRVLITDPGDPILQGISNPFMAGRYHSWVCNSHTIPEELIITAIDEEEQIMACRHRSHPTFGVQFHPESILTPEGKKMIRNFVEM